MNLISLLYVAPAYRLFPQVHYSTTDPPHRCSIPLGDHQPSISRRLLVFPHAEICDMEPRVRLQNCL